MRGVVGHGGCVLQKNEDELKSSNLWYSLHAACRNAPGKREREGYRGIVRNGRETENNTESHGTVVTTESIRVPMTYYIHQA